MMLLCSNCVEYGVGINIDTRLFIQLRTYEFSYSSNDFSLPSNLLKTPMIFQLMYVYLCAVTWSLRRGGKPMGVSYPEPSQYIERHMQRLQVKRLVRWIEKWADAVQVRTAEGKNSLLYNFLSLAICNSP